MSVWLKLKSLRGEGKSETSEPEQSRWSTTRILTAQPEASTWNEAGTIQVGIWYRTINVLDLSTAGYEIIDHRFRTSCESQKPRNHSLKGPYLSYYNNREKPRNYVDTMRIVNTCCEEWRGSYYTKLAEGDWNAIEDTALLSKCCWCKQNGSTAVQMIDRYRLRASSASP